MSLVRSVNSAFVLIEARVVLSLCVPRAIALGAAGTFRTLAMNASLGGAAQRREATIVAASSNI